MALYRGTINPFSLYVIFLRIIPRIWLPLEAAILYCSETFLFICRQFAFFSRTVNERSEVCTVCIRISSFNMSKDRSYTSRVVGAIIIYVNSR